MNTPFGHCTPRPELEQLVKESLAKVNAMTPAERDAMHAAQRASYVRAEMGWPKPNFTWEMRDGVLTKVYASYTDYCNG